MKGADLMHGVLFGVAEIAHLAADIAAGCFVLLVVITGQMRALPGPYRLAARVIGLGWIVVFGARVLLWATGGLD